MIATGLLWYDDDTRRPLAQKIADAAERFRERVGYEPTACQLNPALVPPAPAGGVDSAAGRRSRAPAPVISLRLVPDVHLRPNYFFVGVEAGEPAIGVPGWHDETGDDTAHAARPTTKRPPTAKADTRTAPRQRTSSARAPRSATPAPAAVGASGERTHGPATNSQSPAKTATAAPSSTHAQSKPSRKLPHPEAATPPSAPALIRKSAKAAKTATAPASRLAGNEPGVKSPRPRKMKTPPTPIAPVTPAQRVVAAVPEKPARKRKHATKPAAPTSVLRPAQSSLWVSDPPPARPARKRRTA